MPKGKPKLNPIDGNCQAALKRAMDLILSSIGLCLSLPLFLIVALSIKLDSRGPVIFKQERIGKDGKRFTFYKFRSMQWNADEVPHRNYVEALITGFAPNNSRENDSQVHKFVDDPRITRVGRFLRKTSIDELPQLFNVLKGDMSLVGPRPPIPYEVEQYKDWHRKRLAVKPGLTGLWQVSGRSMLNFDEMVALDIEYIENYSLWLDIKIILRTIPAVLSARGAY
jgi:exopolysaccharide biosynthesis polyprenyl glycosylphosphotransferase